MSPRRAVEWFILLDEQRRARAIPEGDREAARALLRHGDLERATAAERWIGGRTDDAVVHLRRACETAAEAAHKVGVAVDPPAAEYGALLDHYEATRRSVSRVASTTAMRWLRRLARLLIPVAAVLLVLFVRRVRKFVHPIASGAFSPKYDARYAIDGRTDTAWIAPDGTSAWIDFELMPPRPVMYVRMHDTRNPPNNDREVKDFRLEFWRDGRPVDAVEGTYPATDTPGYIRVTVNRTWKVEKVRFVIKTFAQKGGGLAEIELH